MTPGRSLHISSALVGNRKNEMLAIGVGRQTYRSIEDVERELKAARASDDPAFVREAQRKQAELETLERRRKAMEKKRLMESGRKPNQSDDSLFGSDDEEQPDHKRALKSELKATIGSASSEQPEARAASKDRPSKSLATKSYGVNPADFLPGAPFRPLSSKGAAAKSEKPSDDEVRKTKQKLAVGGSRNAGKETLPVPEKVSIPARETPREKFIREDAERKALRREAQKAAGMIDRRPEAGRSQRYEESDGESEEEDSDDYESDGSEGESGASAGRYRKKSKRDDVRSQVWAALGMDRSKYESRDVYSDDDDMEADAASVYAEELRSARQARAEDRREEELERKRELAKAAKKRAREDRR
ncbi:hypothetical protein IE81DRAFT_324856 [Ceraceosorus guamensis]|uniref:SPT2-domain-containing protein n=1 Tax=Ceraceosorus guamensis TaxID=1522189 RepID=A0A316VV36_9BASI|nr:hypothetical protein IE81DRAFT_324856 [Ceraceosorus guamensis]PWN41134.1 hypothetical protein IE81DRAFT_324856 [Ceraceosorus guamensis]